MIKAKGVTKFLDGTKVLDDVNIQVEDGSVYGLLGPNGAGKTTLLQCLSGVLEPEQGYILYDGEPVYENPPVKEKISFMPDELYCSWQENIRDLKELYQALYPSFSEKRFRSMGEIFAFSEKKRIRSFSKGQKRQLAFWLKLSAMPQYLLLDEPLDGLDPVMRRQISSILMDDVARRGMSIVISSHNLRELEDLCDHVGILNGRSLVLERALEELQGNLVKLQVVFPEGASLGSGLDILHISRIGRVYTIIFRGTAEEAQKKLSPFHPIVMDCLPLNLEEIFIYELEEKGYAVKELF